MKTALIIAALVLSAGCGRHACEGTSLGVVCVRGDVTPAYLAEIDAAMKAIGAYPATITVEPAPFPCGPIGLCAGMMWGIMDLSVAYDPSVGLGPAIGSTALEHELCHLHYYSEAEADACAARALPEIRAALGQP